jgi:hypothetical protein
MVRKPDPPWVFQPSKDRYETARYLILHCGGDVAAAHAAIERAADAAKKARGRPQENDTALVWLARAIQRDTGCSMSEARRQAVLRFPGDKQRMIERVKKKNKTTPELVNDASVPLIGISRVDVFTENARKRAERAARALWFWAADPVGK